MSALKFHKCDPLCEGEGVLYVSYHYRLCCIVRRGRGHRTLAKTIHVLYIADLEQEKHGIKDMGT